MNRLLSFIVLLLVYVAVSAQSFMFKHLEVADGLSNNSVYSIYKDRDGFMWFGTGAGLNRFDGYTFKVYRHLSSDSLSLPDNYVKEIAEGPDGLMWVKGGDEYCLFDKKKDVFYRDVTRFMQSLGSNGVPECVYADKEETLGYPWPEKGFTVTAAAKEPDSSHFRNAGFPILGSARWRNARKASCSCTIQENLCASALPI